MQLGQESGSALRLRERRPARRLAPGPALLCSLTILAVVIVFASTESTQSLLPPQVAARAKRKYAEKIEKARTNPKPYMNPGEAQEHFVEKRLAAGATALPVEKYLRALDHLKRMPRYSTRLHAELPPLAAVPPGNLSLLPPRTMSAQGTWTPLGPGNVGGRTRALLIDPGDPNTMYAAGVAGGVWKSVDEGASWTPVSDLIANLAVGSMAMDPTNASVLYVGTGEGYFNGDSVRGAGIFKTPDAGATWIHLASTNNSDFYFVNDILGSPKDSNRVYAATRTGVWRSANGGTTWSRILAPESKSFPGFVVRGGCLDLALRTDQAADILFAACGTFEQASLYRSLDAGVTSPVFTEVKTEAGMGRTSLAIAPSNPAVIYALAASIEAGTTFEDGLLAVFRSTDGGTTWQDRVRNTDPTKLNTLLLTNPLLASASNCNVGTDDFLNQGWYDNVIAVDPADENIVWAGGIDLFRSDDGGQGWGLASYWWASPPSAHADQHAIAFHPGFDGATNQRLYVGNDGGVYRTDNARAPTATGPMAACNANNTGVSWSERNNNYGVTQFYYGLPFPNGDTYFGGTQDNGTLRGNDATGPDGWTRILGGDGGYVAVDPTDTSVLYAETQRGNFFKTLTGGDSFFAAQNGLNDDGLRFITPFLMDPNDPQRLWIGGYFIWRTDNGAGLWTQASDQIPTDNGFSFDNSVTAFAVAPGNSDRVLVGTRHGLILRNDEATTAGSMTSWPPSQPRAAFVSWLAFDPTDENVAYATYSSFGGNHVFKSMDGGSSWFSIDGSGATGLPDVPVHTIVVDPADRDRLYIGTDVGVFVSLDAGANWAVENTGFANVITEALAIANFGAAPHVYAFTHGRGAWRVPTADLGGVTHPVPILSFLSPSTALAGGPGLTLTLTGRAFVAGSMVRWNGADRTTTFVNSAQLQAVIPASDLAGGGSALVTVFNPAPGGGSSNALLFTLDNPVPAVTGLRPDSIPAGSAGFTLTVTGSGFFDGVSTVRWNGSDRPTMFVSGTELQADISGFDVATLGTTQVTVFNAAPSGGTSNALPFTISLRNPVPTVTGLEPPGALAGGGNFMLTVTGSNFVFNSEVQFNGIPKATTFLSETQLQAVIHSADVAIAGSKAVWVTSPSPGGGTSTNLFFQVKATPNPLPSVTGLLTGSSIPVVQRPASFFTFLNGSGFVPESMARWNGDDILTTFLNPNQLEILVPLHPSTRAGPAQLTVFNPEPGGGLSNALTVQMVNPIPTLVSLFPTTLLAGSGGFSLTLSGSDFVQSSVVQWDGMPLMTTFINNSTLRAVVTSDLLAAPTVANVTVLNPGPGGGPSGAQLFTVSPGSNPLPTLAMIMPSSATAGRNGFLLTVDGSDFVHGSVVRWNGADRPTTFIDSTQLLAVISDADVAAPGMPPVTVFNPLPGGSLSNSVSFTLTAPPGSPPSSGQASAGPSATDTVEKGGPPAPSGAPRQSPARAALWVAPLALSVVEGSGATSPQPKQPGALAPDGTMPPISRPVADAPVVESVSPEVVKAGSGEVTLTVRGRGFREDSVVRLNGRELETTYISPFKLEATLTRADLPKPGPAELTVVNRGREKARSNAIRVMIEPAQASPQPNPD